VALSIAAVCRRRTVSAARGEASCPVEGGDLTAAFSKAFEEAALRAVGGLKVR
jgi:hypothetical protein